MTITEMRERYNYDFVFQFLHFILCFPKCLVGVSWKLSVQKFKMQPIERIYDAYYTIIDRKFPRPHNMKKTIIYERGKKRIITPIHIIDRLIQKVLCDYLLVPILSKKLIYDNGASLKDKGVEFSRKRLEKHVLSAIKEFGENFYVLTYDFSDFFGSIPHKTCRRILDRYIQDKELVQFTMEVIKSPFRQEILRIKNKAIREREVDRLENDQYCGMCLGSQVSQVMALIISNELDHYIKDKMKIKYYLRYMDDGLVFAKTKEELQSLLKGMEKVCEKIGLRLNKKKTHITKSKKGFTFMKVKYYVNKDGKLVKKLAHSGIVRMRRKLKKYRSRYAQNLMSMEDVYNSMQSWVEHSRIAQSYITRKNMFKTFWCLFGEYEGAKQYLDRMRGDTVNELLQTDKWAKYRWSCYE